MIKSCKVVVAVICCAVFFVSVDAKAMELADLASKQGYSIGYQLGGDFKVKEIDVSPEALLTGLNDATAGRDPAMAQDQMSQVLMELQKIVEEKRRALFKKVAEENKLAEKTFLAENGLKEGVITLSSGMQYKIIKGGDGPKPGATSTVTVNYRGTLLDGTEFDSSYKRGKSATFPVNKVIPGWTEALQLMPTGSSWILYIPASLGYGERGSAPKIAPNQALVFEVELLKID